MRSICIFTIILSVSLCCWAETEQPLVCVIGQQNCDVDSLSYTQFKTLLESGKIKTVNVNPDGSDMASSGCFDFFGFDSGTIDGLYTNSDDKERKYITVRTEQPGNDPFLIEAVKAQKLSIGIRKLSTEGNSQSRDSTTWDVFDDLWYYLFEESVLLLIAVLVIVCITLYKVSRTKRTIVKLRKELAQKEE